MKTEYVHPSFEGFMSYLFNDPIAVTGIVVLLALGFTWAAANIMTAVFGNDSDKDR